MNALIRETWPDAVVATIENAAFFSLDEKHWPNFATIVWTDEHDEGARSKLSRQGVYRVNIGVGKETFERLVGSITEPDYAGFDRSSRTPSTRSSAGSRSSTRARPVWDTVMPLLTEAHWRPPSGLRGHVRPELDA